MYDYQPGVITTTHTADRTRYRCSRGHEWTDAAPWRNIRGATTTNPLIVAMADDDGLRMKARGLADLLALYARILLKLNPASVPLDSELEPIDKSVQPLALVRCEARRRELAYAVLNVQEDIRSMCSVAALHEEAYGLTELTTTPAGKAATIGRR